MTHRVTPGKVTRRAKRSWACGYVEQFIVASAKWPLDSGDAAQRRVPDDRRGADWIVRALIVAMTSASGIEYAASERPLVNRGRAGSRRSRADGVPHRRATPSSARGAVAIGDPDERSHRPQRAGQRPRQVDMRDAKQHPQYTTSNRAAQRDGAQSRRTRRRSAACLPEHLPATVIASTTDTRLEAAFFQSLMLARAAR